MRKTSAKKKIGYVTNVPQPSVGPMQAEFNQIMAAYCNPRDECFVRMANEFSSAPSAVANPWAVVNQVSNGGPTAPGTPDTLSRDEGMAFIFRDPGRAYVIYNPNPAGTAFTYQCYFVQPSLPPVSSLQIADNSGWMVPIAYSVCLTPSFAPYDQIAMAYTDSDALNKFIWTNINDSANFTLSALANTSSYTITWYKFENGIMVKEGANTQIGAGAPQIVPAGPFTSSAYRAFGIKVTVNGANPIPDNQFAYNLNSLTFTGADAVWEHHALPGYINNLAAATSVRVAAASILCTNQAAQIYKQGRIAALQVPAGNDWTDLRGFEIISSANGSKTLPAETGIYSFLKPTQPSDFDYKVVTNLQNGTLYETSVSIVPQSSFTAVAFSITNSATTNQTSTPGQQLFWTFAYGVEYLSTDVWREVTIADSNPRIYALALEYLSRMPNVYENPLHISELLKKLKSVFQTAVSGIVKYGPTALKIAGMMA